MRGEPDEVQAGSCGSDAELEELRRAPSAPTRLKQREAHPLRLKAKRRS
jgi:hypothetical protein